MGYFIGFLLKNLENVPQREDEYQDEGDEIRFVLWALDYVGARSLEKYRITISKRTWLPVRIERNTMEGKPVEVTVIRNYVINSHLEDRLFLP